MCRPTRPGWAHSSQKDKRMDSNVTALYELLIDQQKSLRDVMLQVESLKAMMFEHRPPFVEAHAAQVARVSASDIIQAYDQRISALQEHLGRLQEQVG
jgi:hypothetical protein